jgi:hypothetical protein
MKFTQNWNIRRTMVLGFAATLIAITAMNVFALTRLLSIHDLTDSVTMDTQPGMYLLGRTEAVAEKEYALVRDLLLMASQTSREPVEAEWRANRSELERFTNAYERTTLPVRDRELFRSMKDVQAQCLRLEDEIVGARGDASKDPATLLRRLDCARQTNQ